MDAAHAYTDVEIDYLARRLGEVYTDAALEMQRDYQEFLAEYARAKEALDAKLEAGTISAKQYQFEMEAFVAQSEHYQRMIPNLTSTLLETDRIAAAMINKEVPRVWGYNYDFAHFEAETGLGINLSYTLANQDTVKQLMTGAYGVPNAVVEEVKAIGWSTAKVENAILQGVIQGKSIDKIAASITEVAGMDYRDATKTARTMMTGAQNSGRMTGFNRLQDMGVKIKKQWVSTLDGRTRWSHRQADGEIKELDEAFEATGLMQPGDPNGTAAEIMNCRCTVVSYLEGIDDTVADAWPRAQKLEGMSYEEWRSGKNPESEKSEYQAKKSRPTDNVATIQKQVTGTNYSIQPLVADMTRGELIQEVNERYRQVTMEDQGISYNKIEKYNNTEYSDEQLRTMLRGMRYGRQA